MGLSAVLAIAAASLLPSVLGHGYVDKIIANGVTYTGWQPYSDNYMNPPPQRIFRPIPGNGPVQDVTLIDVQCNGWSEGGVVGSSPAPLTAPVDPGSEVTVYWTSGWPDSHKGPLITYMAKCPGSCSNYSPGTAAVWFKIQEAGYTNGVWASTPLETNQPIKFKIPANLQPGNYIIRHETIALHAASTYPGAQVYPSCFQVTVGGSGTAFPTSFVSFPGAYKGTDPGITFNMYDSSNQYIIPGPPVWSGSGGSNTTPATSATSSTRTTTTSTRPTSTSTSTRASSTTTTTGTSTSSSSSSGAPLYGQCGGIGWTGPTTCAVGTCKYVNDYYSQCLQ